MQDLAQSKHDECINASQNPSTRRLLAKEGSKITPTKSNPWIWVAQMHQKGWYQTRNVLIHADFLDHQNDTVWHAEQGVYVYFDTLWHALTRTRYFWKKNGQWWTTNLDLSWNRYVRYNSIPFELQMAPRYLCQTVSLRVIACHFVSFRVISCYLSLCIPRHSVSFRVIPG